MKALYTIIRPVITEKATKLAESQKYVFYVDPKATKIDVKHAIKEVYGVDVDKITSLITPAKKRQMKRMKVNKRGELKKVIITLKGNKKLDVTKISKEPKK
jgi:large subunit ribosomal protein L23